MRCVALTTDSRLCQQCGNAIEEGCSRNKLPSEAKYCLMCRADRRRRATFSWSAYGLLWLAEGLLFTGMIQVGLMLVTLQPVSKIPQHDFHAA